MAWSFFCFFFFFNDTATTEIYTLSLHDALPILRGGSTRFGAIEYCYCERRHHAPGPRLFSDAFDAYHSGRQRVVTLVHESSRAQGLHIWSLFEPGRAPAGRNISS